MFLPTAKSKVQSTHVHHSIEQRLRGMCTQHPRFLVVPSWHRPVYVGNHQNQDRWKSWSWVFFSWHIAWSHNIAGTTCLGDTVCTCTPLSNRLLSLDCEVSVILNYNWKTSVVTGCLKSGSFSIGNDIQACLWHTLWKFYGYILISYSHVSIEACHGWHWNETALVS